jgi:GntR family transcriptional regulator, rspAB operon transcriptional repressor
MHILETSLISQCEAGRLSRTSECLIYYATIELAKTECPEGEDFNEVAIASALAARTARQGGQVAKKTELKKSGRGSNRPKIRTKSLSDSAYDQLRNEILSGELAVGDVLSRRRLAARLKMSFLPITEALKRLETEGLVESRPRIGTRVRIPDEQSIRDNNVIREALESQAARLCAQNITAEEKQELLTKAHHIDELHKICAVEPQDSRFLFSVNRHHLQFHLRITELARNRGLYRAIERAQVLIFSWLHDLAAHRFVQPERFHTKLAEALCSGDPQIADAAMRAHVRNGLPQVLERLAKHDGGDNWRLRGLKS